MINKADSYILSELGRQVGEIGAIAQNNIKRKLWSEHNSLKSSKPLVVVFPEGSWKEILPEKSLICEGKEARKIEFDLRCRIYYHEYIKDDTVIERDFKVRKHITGLLGSTVDLSIDWGIPIRHHDSKTDTGAYGFDPVLNGIDDIKKLKIPTLEYDEKETMLDLEEKQELFKNSLNVKLCGVDYIAFHIMYYYTHFRGLEQMMFDLYDEPEFAIKLISFFEKGYHSIIDQCESLNLLELNNDGTYQSTGGFGYTTELPKAGFNPDKVRTTDMWACAEAQEMSSISPSQTENFCISAERRLLSRFGLNGYGCCEGLEGKLQYVKQIPNIRRISVSPFADVQSCAQQLKDNYIFSWKLKPFFLSGGDFDEKAIYEYLTHHLKIIKENNCVCEMILADTHTCQNEPWRFTRWVELCRDAIDDVY